jgi:hypothetical protein
MTACMAGWLAVCLTGIKAGQAVKYQLQECRWQRLELLCSTPTAPDHTEKACSWFKSQQFTFIEKSKHAISLQSLPWLASHIPRQFPLTQPKAATSSATARQTLSSSNSHWVNLQVWQAGHELPGPRPQKAGAGHVRGAPRQVAPRQGTQEHNNARGRQAHFGERFPTRLQ